MSRPGPRPRRRRRIPSSPRPRPHRRSTPQGPASGAAAAVAAAGSLLPPPPPPGPPKVYRRRRGPAARRARAARPAPGRTGGILGPGVPERPADAAAHHRRPDPRRRDGRGRRSRAAQAPLGAVGDRGRRPGRAFAGPLALLAYMLFEVPATPSLSSSGRTEQEACAADGDFNWDVEVRHERSDEERHPGDIIRTAPVAGEELAEEEPFLIVVSDGPEFRTLPDFTGNDRRPRPRPPPRRARAWSRCRSSRPNDESVPVGSVISWTVPADAALTSGGQVLPELRGAARRVPPARRPRDDPDAGRPSPSTRRRPRCSSCNSASPSGSRCSATRSPPVPSWRRARRTTTTDVARGTNVTLDAVEGRRPRDDARPHRAQALPQAQASLAAAGLQTRGAARRHAGHLRVGPPVVGQNAPAGVQFKRGIGRRHDVPAARLSVAGRGGGLLGGGRPGG